MSLRARLKRLAARFVFVVEFCHDCGRDVAIVWTAADSLWDELGDGPRPTAPLCVDCFDRRAIKRGLFLRWRPVVELRVSPDRIEC